MTPPSGWVLLTTPEQVAAALKNIRVNMLWINTGKGFVGPYVDPAVFKM